MKKLISTLLFSCCLFCLAAQEDVKTIKSRLNEATVFLSGAELTHTATASLNKGDNELKIEKLSPTIDRNSIKIRANNSVVVSAFEFSTDDLPLKKPNEGRIKQLKDSIKLITGQLNKLESELKIDSDLTQMLKKGIDRKVSDTLQITDLIKALDYYQAKSTEIDARLLKNRDKQEKLETLIAELNQCLKKESINEYEQTGVLRIRCTSPLAANTTFTISYYTPLAKWIPFYNINVAAPDKPVTIVSNAKVSQSTTVNWENVKLTLSTSTPNNNKTAPLFSAWFLRFADVAQIGHQGAGAGRLVQNAYSYETLDRARAFDLDEKEIIDIPRGMSDYVEVEETMLSQTFNIDLPYTIPGNGKEQSIELKTQDIAAEFLYYCVPKLSLETYLLAEISNWEKLDLLSGKANITYDGTYIGETYINASSTQEKLSLTLGVDKRVVVKRELLKDFSKSTFIGNDTKQIFAYKLTVKNNRNTAVRFVLKEQYPQSTTKEIETIWLEKETTKPTVVKEETGVVTWEETLKAGETKEYRFSYSMKYPKNRIVK